MKVLFLLPRLLDFEVQLPMGLATGPFQARAAVLERAPDRSAPTPGLPLDYLGPQRWLDFTTVVKLRQLVRHFQPTAIHAWGLNVVRWLALADWSALARVVLSEPPTRRSPRWFDRRLLNRVRRIVVHEMGDAERWRQRGFPHVTHIAPGVPSLPRSTASTDRRRIVCLGTGDVDRGFRDAIWAFDILRYLNPELELGIVGAGEDRRRLARFSELLRSQTAIRYHEGSDAAAALRSATVAWVVGRGDASGPCLLAQAHGRATVTMTRSEVVRPGETALVVPAGDKVALAKATWKLLGDESQRDRLAEAGRRSAEQQFPASAASDALARVYEEVAA